MTDLMKRFSEEKYQVLAWGMTISLMTKNVEKELIAKGSNFKLLFHCRRNLFCILLSPFNFFFFKYKANNMTITMQKRLQQKSLIREMCLRPVLAL